MSFLENSNRPATETEQQRAIKHERNVRTVITDLLREVDTADRSELRNKLLAMQDGVDGLKKYLSFTVPTVVYNKMRPEDSSVAASVFQIPELVEQILENIRPIDIMRASLICRSMRDAIEASPELQKALFLRASATVLKHHPLHDRDNCESSAFISRSSESYSSKQKKLVQRINLRVAFYSARPLPYFGARWKRMLICQPPVRTMKIKFSGRHLHSVVDLQEAIVSEQGITIGDIMARMEALTAAQLGASWEGVAYFYGEA